ncbi:hypothetical protein [Sutterella sp.]|uniref:hypothetical protein n=1 Tax=Sutterella sp. TaxID=1981025 RepID=UPI0026E0D855|nr:hypothetical protein [Sutterella sp.]MDO5532357.1 hypothetical protein [Sutterella sp.]
MLDLSNFALYDAARTMRLSIESVPREELLAGIPAELVVASPALAERLHVPAASEEELLRRRAEFAALDEETGWRLWVNPVPAPDGRTVFLSAPDALPVTDGAPDHAIASAGFIVGDTAGVLEWVMQVTDAETEEAALTALSALLSGTGEPPHAARLTELATGAVLMSWPIRAGNPIRALSAAAKGWPEVRFREEDFVFTLRPEAGDL